MKKALLILVAVALACSRESSPPTTATAAKRPSRRAARRAVPAEETPAQASTDVGAAMPAYQAALLDGTPFDLTAERAKHVVFLNVWATWCGPCRFEIPELDKMHAKYAPRGFEVVGASVDESGADAVKAFVKEQSIHYPIVLDPAGKIANVLQTTVLPTSVLIDRNGKIVWRRIGALTGPEPALDAAIEKALK
ncbi:MAG TPA: TlpA disulfide reductase family protein [Thermoanaerobaculia bacterium]|nr:TlpA disulfide reductase family protein [Thermoanaerobaculia bacterium]